MIDAPEAIRPHMRWMNQSDLAQVVLIEAQSFEEPWTEEDFRRCLRQRNCIGFVAELGGAVVGYMLYELHTNHLHLLNLAVAPAWRRRRIGLGLFAKLASKLSSHRRRWLVLDVDAGNLGACLWLRSMEVPCIATRRDFFGPALDAYRFAYGVHQTQEV